MNCEITVRGTGQDRFTLEARWPDTGAVAKVDFEVDPRLVSLAKLIEIAEETRKAGETHGAPQ